MGTTLATLKPPKGAKTRPKRLGRGDGSGLGTTAGRGQKGQSARTGANFPAWFEGGQMPLVRLMPKRGFKYPFRTEYFAVNLDALSKQFAAGAVVDLAALREKGLVPRKTELVKILAEGNLAAPLTIRAQAFSQTALEKIKQAGGTAEVVKTAQ
jgi:large subunit ribosomal protein L15